MTTDAKERPSMVDSIIRYENGNMEEEEEIPVEEYVEEVEEF